MQNDIKKVWSEMEAAEYLGVSPRTLQGYRFRGGGPRYCRLSKKLVRYRKQDIDEWMEKRLASNTTEKTEAEREAAEKESRI